MCKTKLIEKRNAICYNIQKEGGAFMNKSKELDVKKEIDVLYGKLYALNDKLLQRSERILSNDEKYSCLDIFDFYISSHALAYLKSFYCEDFFNASIYLSSRCILEGFALKELCKRGEIDTLKEELLQKQVFLIEYKYYKEFDDIADQILLPEKLKTDWEDACEFFNEKLKNKFSSSKIRQILNSKIPFLCEAKTNYRKIIADTLGEEEASLYGLCSSLVHPSSNDTYKSEWVKIVLPILGLIENEYTNLPNSNSLLSRDYLSTRSPFSDEFISLMVEEQEILNSIAEVFEKKFSNNYVSNTFRTIGFMLPDLAIEKQLGLTEQTKCKWKILLELFSTFSYMYFKCFGEEQRFKLLDIHGYIQTQRNIRQEIDLSDAYEIYSKIYIKPCDIQVFEEAFIKALGYLIDENGYVPSITKVVLDFIKPFESNVENGISIGRAMYLDYMESQMLSHANGYMWFANRGAFNDTNNVFIGIDVCIGTIIEKLYNVFNCQRGIDDSKEYKSIINILRNSNKKLKNIHKKKLELLSLPMVEKWHVN